MKLAIFGATGRTGQILVRRSLEAGYSVVAIVRDATKIQPQPNLEIVVADVLNPKEVGKALAGVDVVLTALGATHLKKSDLLPESIKSIIAAMNAKGIRRLIVLGASGALHPAWKYASLGRKIFFLIIRNTFLKHPMNDSGAQERIVEASDLDYTVVHPPRLLDGPYTGKYRVVADGLPPGGHELNREDLAEFMLAQVTDPTWIRKGPYVAM